jgi:hypothetical protein
MRGKPKVREVSMWVVTRVHADGRDRGTREVVAFFNPRWGAKQVRDHVEQLHVRLCYSPREQLNYASNRKGFIKVRAEIHPSGSGDRCVTCGANPWLEARKVDGFRLVEGERWDWDERSQSARRSSRGKIEPRKRSRPVRKHRNDP